MFSNSYNHGVDNKGRFIMPSKYREQLDGRCCVTRGMDGNCLYIYKIEDWTDFVTRLRQLPSSKKEVRFLQRHFLEYAETVEIDKQGRCLLPAGLREYAEITGEIKLVGMDNKIELWSMENWNKFNETESYDAGEIAETMDFVI